MAGAGAVCGGIWDISGCWEEEAIVNDIKRVERETEIIGD